MQVILDQVGLFLKFVAICIIGFVGPYLLLAALTATFQDWLGTSAIFLVMFHLVSIFDYACRVVYDDNT